MKKFLSMFLALVMLASLALGSVAMAEEAAAKTSATAWLLYFASNHEKDQANFPWWPQHTSAEQPSSETGVEATNAEVTGPGKYTVGLKFNWQKAEGAIQFNLILNDAETLFPGYYVDITDIRVNGASIEVAENLYGTYHDDPAAGMVSIYNSYWDPAFGGEGGPNNHRAFDGTPEDATWLCINPDDIVNGDTIEVDFIVSDEAGKAPEELGAMPYTVINPEPWVDPDAEVEEEVVVPETITTAWIFYQDGDWWPDCTTAVGNSLAAQTPVEITGEGYYTAKMSFKDQGGWTPSADGAMKLHLVFDDGADLLQGYYMNVTDIVVSGKSIEFDPVAMGPTGYDDIYSGHNEFDANDSYAIFYDEFVGTELPWGHELWDSTVEGKVNPLDPSQIQQAGSIEIHFFLSKMQDMLPGVEPPKPAPVFDYVWYPSNTAGLAGLSLKDLGIADDWHNIIPVDLTKTGWQKFTLVGADAYVIGNAYVAVNNGAVTVKFDYIYPGAFPESECVKWFTDLEQITAEELASIENGKTGADVVNIATDLGGAEMAYLSINNKVTFRNPVDQTGATLTRYFRNNNHWKAYREELMAMLPVVEAEAETEAAAE